jgi:hypothetical protein
VTVVLDDRPLLPEPLKLKWMPDRP